MLRKDALTLSFGANPELIDQGLMELVLTNHGRGFARRVAVDMVREFPDGRLDRVSEVPVMRYRWIRPSGTKRARMRLDVGTGPLDATPPEPSAAVPTFWWRVRRAGAGDYRAGAPSIDVIRQSAEVMRRSRPSRE